MTTGWDRIAMGQLSVSSGVHSITLRAPRPGRRMEFYSLELTTPDLARTLEREARARRADTTWMRRVKYGVQFQWTSRSAPRQGDRKPYAEAVRDFPAREFAALVHSTGAGYVILTTSHAEHFFPAPIRAIDRIKPRRTADRDLVRDWIDALGAYGIKLILYYHVGHDDWQQPDGWWQATGFDPRRPQRFLENWRAIVSEVGTRYRDGLAGWFFDDGCVYYPLNPDFRQLTEVAKAVNPDRRVCYMTDFQEYLCGEGYDFLTSWDGLPPDGSGVYTSGPHQGLKAHTNFVLEHGWVHNQLNTPIAPPRVSREAFLRDMKAGIVHGVVPSVNLEIYQDGGVGRAAHDLMVALRNEVKA